jgi:hypothetical protein|tara:strand:- start:443 stop:580 length:138 start_codon:yes stop_codon:yes gene_type:complete
MDDEEIARAKQTGEFFYKVPDEDGHESPGLKEFRKKRKDKRSESR